MTTLTRAAKRLTLPVAQLVFVAAVILLWQWASTRQVIDPFFFGRPSEIWDQLRVWARTGVLSTDVQSTALLLVLGFVIGLLVGAALGTLMSLSRLAHDVLDPFVVFFNAVPRIVLYPFLLVWLGFGLTPKILIIVLVMAPMVAISVVAGFKEVDGVYVANMRALGASWTHLARHVYLPSLALLLLTTCRVSFAFAFQAALVAELLGSSNGLGFLIVQGQSQFDVSEIFSAIALVIVLAIVTDTILMFLEHRVSRWAPARRA
jgi:NitT/TauT family transport system permease protein